MAGAAEVHEQNNKRGARGKQSAVRHYVEAAGDDRAGMIEKRRKAAFYAAFFFSCLQYACTFLFDELSVNHRHSRWHF